MSVQSIITAVSYTSDGVTAAYAVPFYFMGFGDLSVLLPTGLSPMNTGWVGSGTPDSYGAYPNGGTITFQSGQIPAAGTVITISRNTARVQPDSYVDNNSSLPCIIEHGIDRLTLIAQELALFLGLATVAPTVNGTQVGQWYQNANAAPGGFFGWIWTGSAWNEFGQISL